MTTYYNHSSRFYKNLWLTLVIFVVFAMVFAMYVRAEKQIDRANETRLQSFLLADELRQSSDDLTRMAFSYVTTGDPIYKQHFQEILDIRDGKKSRPVNYYDIYWDMVLADDKRPRPDSGQTIALLELMRQAGFTDQELAKMAEAKANSDALTSTEFAAMALFESTKPSAAGVNLVKASQMLNNAAYHKAKASMMRPISDFYEMMDRRSLDAVHAAKNKATLLRVMFILFGLLLAIMLERSYRALLAILGSSVDALQKHIALLGNGNFAHPIPVAKGMENSVMAWLSETQSKLARLDAEHKQYEAKNQRLTQLYAALSQCNQAIVRCVNQEELFPQICRDAVTFGGIKMAWIGLLDEPGRNIRPVAFYGSGTEYLDEIHTSINENEPAGRGPVGRAMREDHPFWCQDFQHDPVTAVWHELGVKYGWKAAAALPLHKNDVVTGVFTLYASEFNAFDEAARNLLAEMVMNIDFALNNFERETRRRQAESALAESYNLLKTIIDTAPIHIFWKDKQFHYMGCNPAFVKDVGVMSQQDIVGKDDFQLCWMEDAELYQADDQQVMESGAPKLAYEQFRTAPDGKVTWLRTSKVPLQNQASEIIGILGVSEDITEQKQAEEHIHYLANFDSLTGLPNRGQLDDHLRYALSLAKRSNGHLALMFLDLDHFKDINDTLGHSVGDAMLVELAKRLRGAIREEDTVTRLGGDEFIFLFPGTDASGAAHVAQKLLDAIAGPFEIEHYKLTLTASIGIALYPADGDDLETLSKSADTAMYRSKHQGRHAFCFFTPEMHAGLARNLMLVNGLNQALERNQFQLYYQPQVSIADSHIIGAEALIRWQHPELGEISPAEFIPVAEYSGLILPIGEWVLRCAVRQAKSWMEAGLAPLTMAVNLSVVQFRHPDLPNLVTRILDEEDLPAGCLELELTESVAMQNPQEVIDVMNNLHECGIRMSIDDFGTGYSSLSYLKKFKVYKLKIDRSFVRDISTDPEDKAIVIAIINLARSLELKTIAEGVETPEQLAFLQKQGCDEIQGYLFSKPLPAERFDELLKQDFND